MKVETLLRAKGNEVATIRSEQLVSETVSVLAARNIGALVVSSDGRTVEGIVSERDIVAHLDRAGAAALELPVSSVMAKDVLTCSPGDDMSTLMGVMTNRRIRHLPVVDAGVMIGMVSIGDVVKARVDELEEDRERLHDYINAR